MIAVRAKDSSSVYSTWLGKSVVLLVIFRQCHVRFPCSIVDESASGICVRIKPGYEMDVRKELILAVEEDTVAQNILIN